MVTRGKTFAGAITTADTKTQMGSDYTLPAGTRRVVGLLVGYGDEAVQEPHDCYITLEIDTVKGPFEFTATMGGAPASATGFALAPAVFIPLDIPVPGAGVLSVYATASGTPESIHVTVMFE